MGIFIYHFTLKDFLKHSFFFYDSFYDNNVRI